MPESSARLDREWKISRRLVSADDLGAAVAWVPEPLTIQATHYCDLGSFVVFYNSSGQPVLRIATDTVAEIEQLNTGASSSMTEPRTLNP